MRLIIPGKQSGDRSDGMDGLMNKIPQSGCVTCRSREYESDLAHFEENQLKVNCALHCRENFKLK